MRVLNKLIYADSYTIPKSSTKEIHIPQNFFNEYIINKDNNAQYIIYFDYSHENFDILNIKRAILIKNRKEKIEEEEEEENIFFYSLIDFDFIKENKSILLKDIKEKMYRIYKAEETNISNPSEFLIITIQNKEFSTLNIYLELRELSAVLL